MSDQNASTPRVFLARHGETEWTISGQCTGKAEIPLTQNGISQVRGTGQMLVGSGRLIEPSRFAHVFVSPRVRAQATFDILVGDAEKTRLVDEAKVTYTEDITEWDYGDYEGKTPKAVNAERKAQGLPPWNIWEEGCPNGESAEQVTSRLDRLIKKINDIQSPFINGGLAPNILVVAHGHILRAFTKRWLKFPMGFHFNMMMEPGAIAIMSYSHHNIEEPAILVGTGFPQPS